MRRRGGEARRDRVHLRHECCGVEHAAHQAHGQRIGGHELLRQEVQLACLRGAEQPRQEPRPRHVARRGDVEERGVEGRGAAREAQVAGGCPAEAGARAGPVDGGDGHLRHAVQQHRHAEVPVLGGDVGLARAVVLEVRPRAEAAAGAGEHQHAHVAPHGDALEAVVRLHEHAVGHRVHALGAVHRQVRDATFDVERDRLHVRVDGGHGQFAPGWVSLPCAPPRRANEGARFSMSARAPSRASGAATNWSWEALASTSAST